MTKQKMNNLFVNYKKAALIVLLVAVPLIDVQAICPNDYCLLSGRQNVYNPIRDAIEKNTQSDNNDFTSVLLKIEGFLFLCMGVAIRKNIIDEREKQQRLKRMQKFR